MDEYNKDLVGAQLERTCPLNHDNFEISVERNYDLRAFKRIVTSGAKDKLNASENICE